ncbi:MAG: TetR/AcrR family transcriptional regulator [Cognatishimia activa]
MRAITPAKKHHHGNLRPALIKAGLELLEEGGIDALTLRKCAARAGVSHAAPAHHFDGLPGLKQAIATEAFNRFSNHLQEAIDRGEQSARGRLKSICRGYLQFGLTHRGLLNVIFGFDGLAAIANPEGKNEAHAYLILRSVCAPFVPEGTDERVIEAQVWSLIHGFTLLYIAGEFGSPPPDIEIGPFDEVMALLDRIGSPPS